MLELAIFQICLLHASLANRKITTRKITLAHFWGHLGGSKNVLQKDLKLSERMSYPNSLIKLCLCLVVFLYRNIAHCGRFWSNFCHIHTSCWFYDHVFAWNHGIQICFLCETQKNLYRNISNFRQFLGKYLPRSLYLLPLMLHFCLRSLWADILL